MVDKSATLWAAITPTEKGAGVTEKAFYVTIAVTAGDSPLLWMPKSVIQNMDSIKTDSTDWQQFMVAEWYLKKFKGTPAPNKPGQAVPTQAVPAKTNNTALAEVGASPIANVDATSGTVTQLASTETLPAKAGFYRVFDDGGKSKEEPNAWMIQKVANRLKVSAEVVSTTKDRDANGKLRGITIHTRGLRENVHVDDVMDFDFDLQKEVFLFDIIDSYERHVKNAKKYHKPIYKKNPLMAIDKEGNPTAFDEGGMPCLTKEASYALLKRWVKAKNFAMRTCTTKSLARVQRKLSDEDWREKGEKNAEIQDIRMVNPNANIVPPVEDREAYEEWEAESATVDDILIQTPAKEEQPTSTSAVAPTTEEPKKKILVNMNPEPMQPKKETPKETPKGASGGETLTPEVMTPGKDTWGGYVEQFSATIFHKDVDGQTIAQAVLSSNGRVVLDGIRELLGSKIFGDELVQELFISSSVHKDPTLPQKVLTALKGFQANGGLPSVQLFKAAMMKAVKG
jgi:hypothetical protein